MILLSYNKEDYYEKITINVREKINSPSALTREQGKIIYNEIIASINSGNSICLDFSDIESLITPFLNVAIGKLYENFSSEELSRFIEFSNIPQGKAASFNLVINNAKRYYASSNNFEKIVKDAID